MFWLVFIPFFYTKLRNKIQRGQTKDPSYPLRKGCFFAGQLS